MTEATTDDAPAPLEQISTGVPGLDDVLGGGLFVGGVYLVAGQPGAGKTLLANQIAFNHVAHGGRALYVTLLAESHARMLLLMERMRFFRPDAVGQSLQYISGYQALEKAKLAGLLRLLRAAMREHRATLLVIDGLLTAHELTDTDFELKKFIYEMQVLAELSGCTSMLLRGAHDPAESYPERTMADGLILLTTTRIGMRSVRELEVAKHRASAHMMGSSFFEILASGIAVYPRTEARCAPETAAQADEGAALLSTGIASLDAMLRGGVRAGSTTMLLGPPAVGKTLLGLQFLDCAAARSEPCLYFGFREPPPRLVRKGKAIGIHLDEHVSNGVLDIQCYPPQEPLADRLVDALLANIRERNVRRLFIDGFGGLRAGLIYPERALPFAIGLDAQLRALGVTVLWSEEIGSVFGPSLAIPTGAAETVDNILLLRHVELRAQIRRVISVIRTADQGHENSLREFKITNRGLQVAPPFETAEAILTGVARSLDQRPQRATARKPTTARARRARK